MLRCRFAAIFAITLILLPERRLYGALRGLLRLSGCLLLLYAFDGARRYDAAAAAAPDYSFAI